jgi:hypothetical protein
MSYDVVIRPRPADAVTFLYTAASQPRYYDPGPGDALLPRACALLIIPSALATQFSHFLLLPATCFAIKRSAMFTSRSNWASSIALLLAAVTNADIKPYISTIADIRTECKTCPRSLCTNQLYYDYDESLNVTCWTRGTKIMGDRLWLKSQAGCYVTQYDVSEYSGDCEF